MDDDKPDNDEGTALVPATPAAEKHLNEVQHLRQTIDQLRKTNTKDSLRWADDLEVRLLVVQKKMDRIESMTIERLGEWVKDVMKELASNRKSQRFVKDWPAHLRDEMFQAVQTAWAAARFRVREAANILGLPAALIGGWMESEEWRDWTHRKSRRVLQVGALADLSMERSAHILSLDTNDPKILQIQSHLIKTVMTAGLQLPDEVPKGGSQRPKSHQQLGDGQRAKPAKAVK